MKWKAFFMIFEGLETNAIIEVNVKKKIGMWGFDFQI